MTIRTSAHGRWYELPDPDEWPAVSADGRRLLAVLDGRPIYGDPPARIAQVPPVARPGSRASTPSAATTKRSAEFAEANLRRRGLQRYAVLEPMRVPAGFDQAVGDAITEAARELQASASGVTIRWYEAALPGSRDTVVGPAGTAARAVVDGFLDSTPGRESVICIRAWQPLGEVVATGVHEFVHVVQARAMGPIRDAVDYDDRETRAARFEERFIAGWRRRHPRS